MAGGCCARRGGWGALRVGLRWVTLGGLLLLLRTDGNPGQVVDTGERQGEGFGNTPSSNFLGLLRSKVSMTISLMSLNIILSSERTTFYSLLQDKNLLK